MSLDVSTSFSQSLHSLMSVCRMDEGPPLSGPGLVSPLSSTVCFSNE